MASYREIKGLTVPYFDSDLPSASASTQEGSVWYNSSTGKLRAFIAYDTWATSTGLNTGRSTEGAGTQTAGLVAGGSPPLTGKTEEYNGSGWAESGDLGTSRYYTTSVGSQTAALVTGGYVPGGASGTTETYNGSS